MTDEEHKHSPLPWNVVGRSTVTDAIVDANGRTIAHGVPLGHNGAFIVRACNSYTRLRKALQACEWSQNVRGYGSCCPSCGRGEHEGHAKGCIVGEALSPQ